MSLMQEMLLTKHRSYHQLLIILHRLQNEGKLKPYITIYAPKDGPKIFQQSINSLCWL